VLDTQVEEAGRWANWIVGRDVIRGRIAAECTKNAERSLTAHFTQLTVLAGMPAESASSSW